MPNHDTFLRKTACVSASARVPNSFVRDFKRQAAELRRTGREEQAVKLQEALNEKIDGVFHARLPLSSQLLCCLYFHLAP